MGGVDLTGIYMHWAFKGTGLLAMSANIKPAKSHCIQSYILWFHMKYEGVVWE